MSARLTSRVVRRYANGDPLDLLDRTGLTVGEIALDNKMSSEVSRGESALVVGVIMFIGAVAMISELEWDDILKNSGTKQEWLERFLDPWHQWNDCWRKILKWLAAKSIEIYLKQFPQSLSSGQISALLLEAMERVQKCLLDPPGGAN
jgi:hypothetical protein